MDERIIYQFDEIDSGTCIHCGDEITTERVGILYTQDEDLAPVHAEWRCELWISLMKSRQIGDRDYVRATREAASLDPELAEFCRYLGVATNERLTRGE